MSVRYFPPEIAVSLSNSSGDSENVVISLPTISKLTDLGALAQKIQISYPFFKPKHTISIEKALRDILSIANADFC